jgi:hypothetical protein
MASDTPSNIMNRLPTELRHQIWEDVLQATSGTSLLLISRAVYEHAHEIFYKIKTFRILSPEDFMLFACSSGLVSDRNKMIRKLKLGSDCLYINDHRTPDTAQHETYSWLSGNEVAVSTCLRAWEHIFDTWDAFSFGLLRSVHFCFRQFARYDLRAWG